MLVEWKEARALSVHVPSKGRSSDKVVFVPGFNEVDDQMWSSMTEHRGVQPFIKSRSLVAKSPARDNKKSGKGLLKFDIPEAEEIIDRTYGKAILQEWKSHENRGAVIQMIDKQIQRVDDSVRLRDEEDDQGPKYGE